MEDTRNTVELQIPSRLECEKLAMETAANVARQMGFSPERIEDLKTAVAEACINAIEHGNRLDDTLPIGVMLSMDDETLEVKVSDSGKGPQNRPQVPDIDKKMHEEHSSRGMGMFLIESLMDEVEWVRCPHTGSYARMLIHLRPEDEMEPSAGCWNANGRIMAEKATQVKVQDARCDAGEIKVLRFAGDITSTSKAAVLGTYQGLPAGTKRILLDFSGVDYLNSSGMALVIQMMIAAEKSGQTVRTFGLKPHFEKVFTMVGITRYTSLHSDEQKACAAFIS